MRGNCLSASLCASVFLLVASTSYAAQLEILKIDFEDMPENVAPAGFSIALTGQGGPPLWTVQREDGGKVLSQTSSERAGSRFPLCIFQNFTASDVEIAVRFKTIFGRIDQAAGVVWRYQNSDNYYVLSANSRDRNIVLYKVENGRLGALKPISVSSGAYDKGASVLRARWNEMRLTARGTRFSVWLNESHIFDVEDETFQAEGRVGLWTKADSVSSFDDLTATRIQP